ncbi:MAG: DnaJ domain-containing protein [Rhodospirillales bacterium]|nr:DnaJ domain-containing protein [Rhodospirillales bacterium]
MPNSRHAAKLGEGARAWNAWRRENPVVVPDLNDLAVPVGHRQFGSVQGGPINLARAELCRAALEHATLIGADLTNATLVEADLSHARLTGADLRGANLSHALLDHADLKDARLDAATVFGAQLRHARNLTQAQIEQASGDENTVLPPHLAMPTAWRRHDLAGSSQVARRSRAGIEDPRADPYVLLGVRRSASMQEVRAAYLMLVKELHPDGRMLDPIAGERLKAINKAYHDIKMRERRAASRRAEIGLFGRPGRCSSSGSWHRARSFRRWWEASTTAAISAGRLFRQRQRRGARSRCAPRCPTTSPPVRCRTRPGRGVRIATRGRCRKGRPMLRAQTASTMPPGPKPGGKARASPCTATLAVIPLAGMRGRRQRS